jgi:hypothetical protein
MRSKAAMALPLVLVTLAAPAQADWGELLGELGKVAVQKAIDAKKNRSEESAAVPSASVASPAAERNGCAPHWPLADQKTYSDRMNTELPTVWPEGGVIIHGYGTIEVGRLKNLSERLAKLEVQGASLELVLVVPGRGVRTNWSDCGWRLTTLESDDRGLIEVPVGRETIVDLMGRLSRQDDIVWPDGEGALRKLEGARRSTYEDGLAETAHATLQNEKPLNALLDAASPAWRNDPRTKSRMPELYGKWNDVDHPDVWIELSKDGSFVRPCPGGPCHSRYYAIKEKKGIRFGFPGGSDGAAETFAKLDKGQLLILGVGLFAKK